MNRLIIETSSSQASIALFKNEQLIEESVFASGRGRATLLFSTLEQFLGRVDSLDEIVVGVGPGSYSGIRIGLSVAMGLKLARNIPAKGVISALGYPGADYQVVLDARGTWNYLLVAENQPVGEPINLSLNELLARVDGRLLTYCERPFAAVKTIERFPLASILGQRVSANPPLANLPLQPLYLREPHTTVAKSGLSIPY